MNQPSDAVLEFAAILGEAIARLHLAGKESPPVPGREGSKGEATEQAANVVGVNNG